MKKALAVFLSSAVIAAALLSGCSSAGTKGTEQLESSPKTEESSAPADTGKEEGSSAAGADAEAVKADKPYKIALITMDSIDQHWVNLNKGAQEAAKRDGVTVDFMSPDTKDDSKQIECVNNAVAGGYDAIMIAANGPDAISGSLKEAIDKGIKLVYVDSPANVDAEASFSTNNKEGGKSAGEEILNGKTLGGKVTDTGVSVLDKSNIQ